MPPCQKSGYGVFTADGKFLASDDADNAKALETLQASKQKVNLKVSVTGEVVRDSIKVSVLKLQ
jgi:hypothetical protein